MIELDKLIKFLNKHNLSLVQSYEDTLKVRLSLNQLETLITALKENKAHFEAQVVSKKQNILKLKYFFYIGIKAKLLIVETSCEDSSIVPSLASYYPAIYRYERESSERFKVKYNDSSPPCLAFDLAPEFEPEDTNTIDIPVGPIHAGVIEPGHFHFTCHGEHIVNLEISLGYLYKNLEFEFENRHLNDGLELSQHICGDSIVAYSLAYSQAIEKIQNSEISEKTQYTRMILLELERLYNHVGDIGGILNDTGFSLSNSYLSALKEKILRINNDFFGHRFLRGAIKLGGVNKDLNELDLDKLKYSLKNIKKEFDNVIELSFKHKTVLDRLSKTGHLKSKTAKTLSVKGVAGKASGVSFDSRRDLGFANYSKIKFHSHLRKEGDVYARFNIRIDEVGESFKIINQCLEKISLDEDSAVKTYQEERLSAWSIVEAARGPVFIYVELEDPRILTRVKIRDISQHNWKAVEYAVLKNIIPDFPLCNKSFSLSYAGTDL